MKNQAKFLKILQNPLKPFRISQDPSEYLKTLQNFSKLFRISQNPPEFLKTLQNLSKNFRISQTPCKLLTTQQTDCRTVSPLPQQQSPTERLVPPAPPPPRTRSPDNMIQAVTYLLQFCSCCHEYQTTRIHNSYFVVRKRSHL